MAVTQLQLFNIALGHIEQGAITQAELDGGLREPARLLSAIWAEDVVLYALEKALWTFATRTAAFSPSGTVTPPFGYRNAFEKPVDYVETVAVGTDEYFYNGFERFSDEAGFWFSDVSPYMYVKYVSSDASYGRNVALWPQSFWQYMAAYMAWRVAPRLNNSKTDEMFKMQEAMLKMAQGKDALKRPTTFMPRGSWSKARTGYRGRKDRESSGWW